MVTKGKGSARRSSAKPKAKTSRSGGSKPDFILSPWADAVLLLAAAAAFVISVSIYYPNIITPVGPALNSWIRFLLGIGAFVLPAIFLIVPLLVLKSRFQQQLFKAWAWAWSLTFLASLVGGMLPQLHSGGALGDSCAALGTKYLGFFYYILVAVVALLVIGRLVGRSLIIPLAKGTVRAAIKTGEAVADVGSAMRDEAVNLAEQRKEKLKEQAKERRAAADEREKRQMEIIQAELAAADAPEGDSPLIKADRESPPGPIEKEGEGPGGEPDGELMEGDVEATGGSHESGGTSPGQPDEMDKDGQLLIFPSTQAGYALPPITLLKNVPHTSSEEQFIEKRARVIEKTLSSFNIEANCIDAVIGPRVTRFELKIGPGINVSKIHGLADNLALELAVKAVRIEAPIPGKSAVGIEVPNASLELITLRSVIESPLYQKSNHPLTVGLGRDIAGNPIIANIAKMPHVLVAGATNSGKSVCLNALIVSLLMRNAPDTLRMILIDPKRVEMTNYKDIPHLACPVVHDVMEAQSALKWAVAEMERRYKLLEGQRARNIAAFNEIVPPPARLPFIVIFVDELADLMMMAGQVIEKLVCRIAQMSRAVGIHLVIATQRPDVKVITGTIKANIPSRVAFSVVSQIDSRTILDSMGAEKLLGSGDMLFSPIGENIPLRVQGAFLDDAEIDRVVEWCRSQAEAHYDESITTYAQEEDEDGKSSGGDGTDEFFGEAMEIVQESQRASTSYLQRRLKIGYNRAARIMEELEEAGVVSPPDVQGNRKVL